MGPDASPRSRRLPQALERLKREGSAVMVAGPDEDAHRAACEKLLGGHGDGRHRVVVGTHSHHEFAAGADDRTVVVDESKSVQALGTSVVAAVDDLEGAVGGLEPGSLRVCVDALDGLVRTHGTEATFRLAHVLNTRTRRAAGMAHCHLTARPDTETAMLLEPLFDAILEVRTTGEGYLQRWDLPDAGLESDWIAL